MKIISLIISILLLTGFCLAEPDIKEESLIHGLSNSIVEGCKTNETKILALMSFVHDTVKPKTGEDPYKQLSTLERIQTGVGWCNHQATVFMHLAYYQEIKTRLLYLMDSENKTSPHTIAEMWDGERWVIVDPMFMITGITRDRIRQENMIDDKPFSWFRGNFPLIADRPDEWLRCYINEPQIVFEYNP